LKNVKSPFDNIDLSEDSLGSDNETDSFDGDFGNYEQINLIEE